MRIAYVCYWNVLRMDGVARKIASQSAHWEALGHETRVFCLSRASSADVPWELFTFGSFPERVRQTRKLERAVRAWAPDVVYVRHDVFLPPLGGLLRAVPAVAEVQTNEIAESTTRISTRRASLLYEHLSSRLILSRVDGIVTVSDEIAGMAFVTSRGKPTIVIGNGIDLDGVPELPPPNGDRRRVAFLASMGQPWHGVDKIVWLAEQLPDVVFHFIGWAPENFLAPPPANVVAHGVLAREQYEPILASCDAGIGTLALHRLDMNEASTLKVREYLAHGLPVVLGYEDTDLKGLDPWYVLQLPNEESNVRDAVGRIRRFLDDVHGRRVPRQEIADRIDAAAKERIRLDFLGRFART
jgi:glycosyltransferase involved in cell wall biosynthesis